MRLTSLSIVVLFAAGCHLGPKWSRHLELLNAEKRTLEDELYALQYELEDAISELREVKRENAELRSRLGIPAGERTDPSPGPRSIRPPSKPLELTPPAVDEELLQEPKIEIPDSPPKANSSSPARGGGALAPPSPPGAQKLPPSLPRRELPSPAGSIEPSDPRITHIYLNPLLTGGTDFDREPGDDGIIVVLEPRNRNEEFVPLAGPVTVVLLDPARQDEESRFARWEVDAGSVHQLLEGTAKVKGIHLRLPWLQSPPTNSRMHLFVRYVTVDGRKLEADREIFLALPGQLSQRWTPRSPKQVGTAGREVPVDHRDTTGGQAEPQDNGDVSRAPATLPEDIESVSRPMPSKSQVPSSERSPAQPSWKPYRETSKDDQ